MNSRETEKGNRSILGTGSFLKSFSYALQGIRLFFRNERNGRLQLIISFSVSLVGLILSLSIFEWLIIILFITIIISLEMFNSALEKLCDKISPELNPQIKEIKDMAAGAVLWASIISIIAGMLIFIPKIIELL
jgi:diacylglycerol kinase